TTCGILLMSFISCACAGNACIASARPIAADRVEAASSGLPSCLLILHPPEVGVADSNLQEDSPGDGQRLRRAQNLFLTKVSARRAEFVHVLQNAPPWPNAEYRTECSGCGSGGSSSRNVGDACRRHARLVDPDGPRAGGRPGCVPAPARGDHAVFA